MLKTIGKTVLWTILLIAIPIILIVLLFTLGVAAPIIGVLALIFLPAIIIGVIIGHTSSQKERKNKE